MTLTTEQAQKRGFRIVTGDYHHTTDDTAGRWYIEEIASDMVDHRGKGFATKGEALRELEARLDARDFG